MGTATTGRAATATLVALVGVAAESVAVAAAPTWSARGNELAVAVVIVAWAVVGLVIVRHRPGHPVGRLALLVAAVWAVGEALDATAYAVLVDHPGHRGAALVLVLGTVARDLPWFVAIMWLPLRFPDWERADTRLSRVAEWIAGSAITGLVLVDLFSRHPTDTRVAGVPNPIAPPAPIAGVVDAMAALALLLGLAAVVLAVAVLVQRYRRGGPLDRQQTLVFGLAFALPIPTFAASATDWGGPWLFAVASLPLPVAIGIALLQRRLYDIPLAVNRSLTYGSLWLAIAALYAVTVVGVGLLFRETGAAWLPWLAAGVVAVSFAPLRDALQRAANRLTYGQWSRPDELLAATARRLGDAHDLPGLLQSLVDDVGTALDLPHVAISDSSGHDLASHGSPTGDPADLDELPMTSYGVPVGTLAWTRQPLRPVDRELLVDLSRQLGTVVHAAHLLETVRGAQERLVLAREEERRRLRRDLHDGLGPALAGLTLRVDTLRNQLDARADAGLLDLRSGIQSTVLDVRRIVEGLRPPALDDLGLADAIDQLARRVAAGGPLRVEVHAEPLLTLPAAVEVAAYRIAQEALTNAVHHSGATHACVRLARDGRELTLEVRDDGSGLLVPRADGIGLISMRERAEEIGGRFELEARPGVGTRVGARLPVT